MRGSLALAVSAVLAPLALAAPADPYGAYHYCLVVDGRVVAGLSLAGPIGPPADCREPGGHSPRKP